MNRAFVSLIPTKMREKLFFQNSVTNSIYENSFIHVLAKKNVGLRRNISDPTQFEDSPTIRLTSRVPRTRDLVH